MFRSRRSSLGRAAAAAVAGVIAFTVPMAGCTGENNSESKTSQSAQVSADTKFGNDIVIKSEHFELNKAITEYLLNYFYQRFSSNYGTSYFDTTKSLKEQYYDQDKGQTWYDYFLDYTKNYIEQTLVFAEAATEAGKKLSEDNLSSLSEGFSAMESAASENSMSVDEFIRKNYGDDVTKEDIENIQKITLLAQNYSDELYAGFEYSDKDYEKYYKDNKNSFDMVDYLTYTFPFTTSTDDGSAAVDDAKKSVMKENADALAASKSVEEFEDYITQYLKANPNLVSVSVQSSESSITEEDFNNAIESTVKAAHKEKQPISDLTDADKWIFDSKRKSGDTTVIETETGYNVYMIAKTAYRDESINKNVRHILIKAIDEDEASKSGVEPRSDEEAKAKAEEIYEEWKKGEATEDTFAEMAMNYSEDTGSAANGGLYENVYEGQMVPEFNDWLFDPSRKAGDTGIVKTQFGYHIMYFSGSCDPSWQITADTALRTNDMKKKYDEFSEKYKVEYDDEALNALEIRTATEESSAAADDSSKE